jgi:hypothetical protein
MLSVFLRIAIPELAFPLSWRLRLGKRNRIDGRLGPNVVAFQVVRFESVAVRRMA